MAYVQRHIKMSTFDNLFNELDSLCSQTQRVVGESKHHNHLFSRYFLDRDAEDYGILPENAHLHRRYHESGGIILEV